MLDNNLLSSKPYIPPIKTGEELVGNLMSSKKSTPEEATKAAKDFEAVFLSQMLAPMWAGVGEDNFMGGGSAEETYRTMLVGEYGKLLSKAGGLGISDAVQREILRMQEKQS
ncbi:MAG: chemotaxis protein [Alphaproteobacteria bacterium]|nr:chemotaxis protein [Alphaproteobacteria bacterium]